MTDLEKRQAKCDLINSHINATKFALSPGSLEGTFTIAGTDLTNDQLAAALGCLQLKDPEYEAVFSTGVRADV